MIIKTTQNLSAPSGSIVSGVTFRAIRERDGYRINSGEHNGIYVPDTCAMVLSDVQVDENGNRKRGSRYD
ncbi:hypothetical protein ACDZ28_04090 [Paenibacillus sp. RS8]|uniref:hypothetical protein n=1 Tax=Paenibacillus sp. RS8 TaxID=3242681 RepID=UPI0035C1C6E6